VIHIYIYIYIYDISSLRVKKYKRGKITDTPPLFLPYKQVEMLHKIHPAAVKFRDQMAQGIK